MIKRYFLFLLFLLSAIGSISAVITVPENCTESNYFVIITNDYNDSEIISAITAVTYSQYTPVVTGVQNNMIYFEAETDMARFLMPYDYTNYPLPVSAVTIPYGQVLYSGQLGSVTTPATRTVQTDSFNCYALMHSYYSASCNIQEDGVTKISLSSDSYQNTYKYGTFQANSGNLTINHVGSWSDRGSRMYLFFPDATEFTDPVTEIAYSPASGCIEIYTSPDTQIYESDFLIGTTDNGGYLQIYLPLGEHTLKFVKDGYWDVLETYTVNLESQEIYVSLAPENAIFQISKEFSGNIYPNSISTLSMDITPIKTAYAAKLRISGVEVNKVYYQTEEIPKTTDGYYILGDVSSIQNIEIEFKTPQSWGEKTFTVELTATDIEGTAYTNLETINYEVLELPFLLEMPETFGIGLNDITLTEMSGDTYSVLMVLYDSDDVELWSSSTSLLEYCGYTFEVPIDDAGDYTLELNAKSGTVKTYYSIEIIEPVTLITEEITANPGKTATVQFKISNPTASVKYYTAELSCPFFNESISKTFSIAPETVDKTVDISFEVPEELELENYQLTLEISDPDKTDPIYSGNVVLTISTESLLFASVPGGNTTLIILAAAVLLIAGTFAVLRLKK